MAPRKSRNTKQNIVDYLSIENLPKSSKWQNTIISLNVLYLSLTWLLTGGNMQNVAHFFIAVAIHFVCIEFLSFMAHSKSCGDSILLSSYKGTDASEHYKDTLTWICACQVLSLISNTFLLLWLVTPTKAAWIAWTHVVSPWLTQPNLEFVEKKRRNQKGEKKGKKLQY